MFDAVRNNRKIVQGFLFLIAASFALYGVNSYVRSAGPGNDLAVVGDTKITQQEFRKVLLEQMEKAREKEGPNFRQDRFDTPATREAIVNALIDRRLLLLEALNGRIGASNDLLVEIIASMPSLKDEKGNFSRAKYEDSLRQRGMTPDQFEAQLRHDLTMQQLVGAVGDTGIASATSAEMMLRIRSEERQVAEVRLTPESFLGEVKLDADAEQKYYDANRKQFETPERVKADYVVLSLDNLLAQTKVSEAEVKQWYESHLDRFQTQEERRASHILITVAANASDADKAKARAKADEILATVRKTPARFAELAKQNSQDPGSAANGGDLGFFGRGMMVKPFEDAAFALADGQISDVVQSDFGFHIIKLTGVKPLRQKPMEEVRGEIEGELKRQAAQRRFAEIAESFSNMVYEQSDSLQPVVDKFGLKIEQSKFLPKNLPPQALPALGPLGNEKLLAALFSDDAIKQKRNTDAVEVAQNTIVAARVAEYQPAAVRPFDSVKADIGTLLRAQASAAMAKSRGESTLAALKGGKDEVRWALVKNVSRLQGKQVPPQAMQAIFRTDVSKLPAYAGVELPNNGGYALYKILAVKPLEKVDPDKRRVLQADYATIVAQEDFAAYLGGLRKRYKVEINQALLESKDR